MFIPAATSVTTVMVFKTDFYTVKDTGEVRASVQAVSAIPAGANGNAKGFELTEYMAEASVIDQIDFSNGPVLCKFEAEVRPITNRFGKTTNTQVFTKLIQEQPQRSAHQPQVKTEPAKA